MTKQQLQRLTKNSSTSNTWDQCWQFQFWCLCVSMQWQQRWSGVCLGHQPEWLVWYPAAAKHLWTVPPITRCSVPLISPNLILNAEKKTLLLIRGRVQFSFGVIVFNRCPRSPWVRLLLSRTRCKTFSWHLVAPCDSNSQNLPLRKRKTSEPKNIFNN